MYNTIKLHIQGLKEGGLKIPNDVLNNVLFVELKNSIEIGKSTYARKYIKK